MFVVMVITRGRSKIICWRRHLVVLANLGPEREYAVLPVHVQRANNVGPCSTTMIIIGHHGELQRVSVPVTAKRIGNEAQPPEGVSAH